MIKNHRLVREAGKKGKDGMSAIYARPVV